MYLNGLPQGVEVGLRAFLFKISLQFIHLDRPYWIDCVDVLSGYAFQRLLSAGGQLHPEGAVGQV